MSDDIPICPYDGNDCVIQQMYDQFKDHGYNYLGLIPVCQICALHKLDETLKDAVKKLDRLRYTS